MRRFLGTPSETLCHRGGAGVLRDFMAVGVVALLLIPHDGLLWLKLD